MGLESHIYKKPLTWYQKHIEINPKQTDDGRMAYDRKVIAKEAAKGRPDSQVAKDATSRLNELFSLHSDDSREGQRLNRII